MTRRGFFRFVFALLFAWLLIFPREAGAANRFWVGATGTWNASSSAHWSATSGGAGGQPIPTTTDNVFFDANSGTSAATVTIGASSACAHFSAAGFPGTIAGSTALTISDGDFEWSAVGTFVRSYTGALTFADATTGTHHIKSDGVSYAAASTVNGANATFIFDDPYTSSNPFTLTAGTLNTNGQAVQSSTLVSSNSNVRGFNCSNTTWTAVGTGVVFSFGTDTNLTVTKTNCRLKSLNNTATTKSASLGALTAWNDLEFAGSGSGQYTVNSSNSTVRDVFVTNTGGAAFDMSTLSARTLDFTGFNGSWLAGGAGTLSLTGNLVLVAGMTMSRTAAIAFTATSGTESVTSAGQTIAAPLTKSGIGGALSFADPFVTTAAFTLTSGAVTTNAQPWTAPNIVSSNSSVRSFDASGSAPMKITSSGTVWDSATGTNLTVTDSPTTEVQFTDASATTKTITLGGQSLSGVWYFKGTSPAPFVVNGSNTYGAWKIDPDLVVEQKVGQTATFTAAGAGLVSLGTAGHLATIHTDTSGSTATISKPSGRVVTDFLSLRDITATGGAFWFVGSHSTNVSKTKGFRFTPLLLSTSLACTNVDPGSLPGQTCSVDTDCSAARCLDGICAPIDYVILLKMENRSFDHYFGMYPGVDGLGNAPAHIPDPLAPSGFARPYHDTAVSGTTDQPHERPDLIADVNGGLMNQFCVQAEAFAGATGCCDQTDIACAGSINIMGYHTDAEIPNYWAYAQNFALDQYMFSGVLGPSLPNALGVTSCWAADCTTTDPLSCSDAPAFNDNPNDKIYAQTDVTYLLHQKSIPWKAYRRQVSGTSYPACNPANNECPPTTTGGCATTSALKWSMLEYMTDVADDGELANATTELNTFFSDVHAGTGTFPNVAWIAPPYYASEHAPCSVTTGEKFSTGIINAIGHSNIWPRTVIFLFWDDPGGYYDHVVPGVVDGNGYGIRVPAMVISPYAKAGYIDSQNLSFDAYIKFIEDLFHLGRLNPATDGRPDSRTVVRESLTGLGNLLYDFDFSQPARPPLFLVQQ